MVLCRADPDLQIRAGGGGDGHPDAEKRGEGPVSKIIFFGPLSLSLV